MKRENKATRKRKERVVIEKTKENQIRYANLMRKFTAEGMNKYKAGKEAIKIMSMQ